MWRASRQENRKGLDNVCVCVCAASAYLYVPTHSILLFQSPFLFFYFFSNPDRGFFFSLSLVFVIIGRYLKPNLFIAKSFMPLLLQIRLKLLRPENANIILCACVRAWERFGMRSHNLILYAENTYICVIAETCTILECLR